MHRIRQKHSCFNKKPFRQSKKLFQRLSLAALTAVVCCTLIIGCGKLAVPPPTPQTGDSEVTPVLKTAKPPATKTPTPSTTVAPRYPRPVVSAKYPSSPGNHYSISSLTGYLLYHTSFTRWMLDLAFTHRRSLPSKPDVVDIILTFDDGPHTQILQKGRNYTENILNILKVNHIQKDIKAVFFVQTHAPNRGSSLIGRQLLARMAAEGHIIGVHTGSTKDHVSHRIRCNLQPYDCTIDGVIDRKDGQNALESDLIRAKERILRCTGMWPFFVRPTYGQYNNAVVQTYARQRLKMIMWDIDSKDNYTREDTFEVIAMQFRRNLSQQIRSGNRRIIILFHDINWRTQMELECYLELIVKTVREHNMIPHFPQTPFELHQLLLWKAAR